MEWSTATVEQKLELLRTSIRTLADDINRLSVGHQTLSGLHERTRLTVQEIATAVEALQERDG